MNAHRLIEDARAAGLSFEVEDGDLMVEAERDPPDALIAELREHKAELIAVLAAPALETAPCRSARRSVASATAAGRPRPSGCRP